MSRTTLKNDFSPFFDNTNFIVDNHMPDPVGEMFIWNTVATFISLYRGGAIQVAQNDLLWFPMTGGIWIETIFSKTYDKRIYHNLKSLGLCPKSEYIRRYKEKVAKLLSHDETKTHLTESGFSFRFFVPPS